MRILFLAPRLPHAQSISGNQIVFRRMDMMLQRGHDVGLACFITEQDQDFIEGFHLNPGLVDVEFLPEPSLNRMMPKRIKYGRLGEASSFVRYRSPEMMRKVGEMVERSKFDVVIAEFTAMGKFLHKNPFLPAVRKIISCHESATLNSRKLLEELPPTLRAARVWLEQKHMQHLEFSLYRSVDRIVALTPEEKYGLLDISPDLDITVIPAGVDINFYLPDPDAEKEDAIIFTGRFTSDQNQRALRWFAMHVWPMLKAAHPELTFYIVGHNPPYDIRRLGMRDPRVEVTGTVADVRPFMSRSKMYVCPLRTGTGMRVKLLEAMSMGLPVITTQVGAEGIPIHMGETGFIANTPELFCRYIGALLADPILCRRMGVGARRMVEQRFSWEYGAGLLEELLVETVAKRPYSLAG